MPSVEGLQQIGDLGTPDLADDDVIGPVAQGVPDQIPDRHPLVAEPARLEAQAIGPYPPPPRDQDVTPATWARGWIDNSSD